MITLEGVPGSFQKGFKPPRWYRCKDDCGGRTYDAVVDDGKLVAVVSHDAAAEDGGKLWHLSVSHRGNDGEKIRVPTYDELKHAKYQLLPRDIDVPMVLIFPKKGISKEKFVDIFTTTLHLWEAERSIDE